MAGRNNIMRRFASGKVLRLADGRLSRCCCPACENCNSETRIPEDTFTYFVHRYGRGISALCTSTNTPTRNTVAFDLPPLCSEHFIGYYDVVGSFSAFNRFFSDASKSETTYTQTLTVTRMPVYACAIPLTPVEDAGEVSASLRVDGTRVFLSDGSSDPNYPKFREESMLGQARGIYFNGVLFLVYWGTPTFSESSSPVDIGVGERIWNGGAGVVDGDPVLGGFANALPNASAIFTYGELFDIDNTSDGTAPSCLFTGEGSVLAFEVP